MINNSHFRGTWTALVTPFKEDESIDYDAIGRLVEDQIRGGVTGILVVGTTGESPTITESEFSEIVQRVKKMINGRCLFMVNCGTNSTAKSIKNTKIATQEGADVILVVNPYYNKPTQKGLYLHFRAVAEATNLPVFVYNIKGRTAVNVSTDTLMRLAADVPNIVGVKEASGDLAQIAEVCQRRPEGFVVLSGDDGITASIMEKNGADGVISVASNLMPREVSDMVRNGLDGNFEAMRAADQHLQQLFKDIFIETNPIPVKTGLALMGKCQEIFRLPMCTMEEENRNKLIETLKNYSLL